MKPIYCRSGSKRSLIKKILPLIPEHTVYVESFIGGGAIYLAKEPSEYEIINENISVAIFGLNNRYIV